MDLMKNKPGLIDLKSFNPDIWQKTPIHKPGIYVFYSDTQCLYVGQALKDVSRRAERPCLERTKTLQGLKPTKIAYIPLDVEDIDKRKELLGILEGWCIYLFNPICNKLRLVYLDIFSVEKLRKERTSLSKKSFAIVSEVCANTYSNKSSNTLRPRSKKRRHSANCHGFNIDAADRIANALSVNIEDILYVPPSYPFPVFHFPVYRPLELGKQSEAFNSLNFDSIIQLTPSVGLESKSVYFRSA